MARADDWARAQSEGRYGGSVDDRRDGFIHFSTAAQVRESAARHRVGQDNLVLLELASDALGPALKWEAARGGQLFPHLYGVLDPKQVIHATPLRLGADGRHVFPPDIP